jgi:hypothetical protein
LNRQKRRIEPYENGCGIRNRFPLIGFKPSHSNVERNQSRLGFPDPGQRAQLVEAPGRADIKVLEDRWVFELDLFDVIGKYRATRGPMLAS